MDRETARKALEVMLNMRGFSNRQCRRGMISMARTLDIITQMELRILFALIRKSERNIVIDAVKGAAADLE